MVRITEDLIRKRAEHNNMEISTLEEISLHQQDIERIEHLDKLCRELKILYLQSNLIPKIENVGRLKKMEYLNMALNNVERVENLEGCESLKKLDLTINFVGELTSLESLKENYNLKELFLTGNPCTKFEGYREYVIAVLPQLKYLDGKEVDKSERIKAIQALRNIRPMILQQEEDYRIKREKEKEASEKSEKQSKETKKGFDGRWYTDVNEGDSSKEQGSTNGHGNNEDDEAETMETEEDTSSFWQEETDFTPESRIAVHDHVKKAREKDEKKSKPGPDVPKRRIRLKTDDGKLLNVNEAKIDFSLTDDEENNCLCLDVACYKHLDTSLLDVDVQPTHVKVVIKGKVFQLVLTEEIMPDSSKAQRSQTTGHLLIKMPKVNQVIKAKVTKPANTSKEVRPADEGQQKKSTGSTYGGTLEVDPTSAQNVDLMVTEQSGQRRPYECAKRKEAVDRPNSQDFVDDPDVPPLM
ncbi:protein tilB homolog [Patiria miniata]|uniref:U2A'/phosphoprotein 32 family A C-terminal domain-containing protein n=1 Tax=Patiria miniata TaxID=46514 RepID=A0A914A1E4_PATMI|nr:protein tilB homolog [Patiria miniata]